MSQARALSSDDVRGLREELAAGSTPTVWFTSSAVGVPEGRSGKVTALDEPAEGDFVQVRPAGSKDVLSFSASEVTVVKPPRGRKETASTASRGKTASGKGTSGEAASSGATASSGKTASQEDVPGGTPSSPEAEPAVEGRSTKKSTADAAAKSGSTSAKPSGRKTTTSSARANSTTKSKQPRQPGAATVTLTADPEGQWNVEVSNGKKRVLRPTGVPASAVAHAAKALHEDVAQAVEPLLESAREHQRAKIEQLQQELSEAQRRLDDLTG